MKPQFVDITGIRFGRLVPMRRHGKCGNAWMWLCQCDCGSKPVILGANLRRGMTRSCGCLRREVTSKRMKAIKTHGMSNTPTYVSWQRMWQRCGYTKDKKYHLYGGRGIMVCKRWSKFENFLSDMGERPPGRTLGRIDPDGNYHPANCAWQTPYEQRHNRSKL